MKKYLKKANLFLNKNILIVPAKEKFEGLEYWKQKIYNLVATVMIVFGVPLLLFGATMFYIMGQLYMATLELMVALFLVVIVLSPGLSNKIKKILIIILMYFISLVLLIYTGPLGAGFVGIVFTIVLSGCILDSKHIKILVTVNFIEFIVLSLMMVMNLLDSYPISDYGFTWAINLMTSQALAITLLLLIHKIYQGLEDQNHKILDSKSKLKIKDARYEAMVEHIFDVITIVDDQAEFKYLSPNIYKLYGWKSSALLGNKFLDFVHSKDRKRIEEVFNHILTLDGESITEVFQFLKGNGGYAYIEVTGINLINNPNIVGVLASFRDVTTRVFNEAALIKAKEKAENAEKAKSQFLSVMSHEIRTPLNGIMGMNQLLLETNPSSEQKNYLEVSMTSSKMLLNLINDVLDYSKLKAYSIVLEKTEINIRKILGDLEYMYTHEANEKNISFRVGIDDNIHEKYIGDAFRLRQVLMNLLNNAFKFTSEGFVEIQVDLYRASDKDVKLIWTVSDSGIGMSNEQVAQIFDMFYQGEVSISRKYGGSGLGLPICKDIIDLMGGQIWVSSEINKGSIFKFTCVFEKYFSSKPFLDEKMDEKHIKILVAEDDQISRLLLKKFSKNMNWQIYLSRNGQELLEAYKKDDYDIILMDVNMPIMDGLQVSEEVRKIDMEIPIIGISAFASPSDVKICLEAGMNTTVSKPIDFKLLKDAIVNLTNKDKT